MAQFIENFGALAPIIYVLLFAILPIFFFPIAVLATAGGLVFGLKYGLTLTLLGTFINCYIMFILSRKFARNYVTNLLAKKLNASQYDRIFNIDEDKLFITLIILRLTPFIPYSLVNYAFGLTNIRLSKFMLGAVIGKIPTALVYLNLGVSSNNILSTNFLFAFGLVILLTIFSIYLGKLVDKSKTRSLPEETNNVE